MRLCVLNSATSICENVIEADTADIELADGFYFAPDNTGEVGWTWAGSFWKTASDIFLDAALQGTPTAPSPALDVTNNQIATAFFVDLKVQEAINSIFLSSDYVATWYDDTGGNLAVDFVSDDYTDANGNLAVDLDGGTY